MQGHNEPVVYWEAEKSIDCPGLVDHIGKGSPSDINLYIRTQLNVYPYPMYIFHKQKYDAAIMNNTLFSQPVRAQHTGSMGYSSH